MKVQDTKFPSLRDFLSIRLPEIAQVGESDFLSISTAPNIPLFDEFVIETPPDIASMSMVAVARQVEEYVKENNFKVVSRSNWPFEEALFPGMEPTIEEFPKDWPTMRITSGRCNFRDITMRGRDTSQAHCVKIAVNDESNV